MMFSPMISALAMAGLSHSCKSCPYAFFFGSVSFSLSISFSLAEAYLSELPDGLVSTEPRGQLYDCRFNGSCFPLGQVKPIGYQSFSLASHDVFFPFHLIFKTFTYPLPVNFETIMIEERN